MVTAHSMDIWRTVNVHRKKHLFYLCSMDNVIVIVKPTKTSFLFLDVNIHVLGSDSLGNSRDRGSIYSV